MNNFTDNKYADKKKIIIIYLSKERLISGFLFEIMKGAVTHHNSFIMQLHIGFVSQMRAHNKLAGVCCSIHRLR